MNQLQRSEALSDIDLFQRALEERFAYLRTHSVEYPALLDGLRERLPYQMDTGWFGLELQKVLARFQDAHALVNARPPVGFLPFLVETVGDRLVALDADRSSLLDAQRPYLVAIDGVDAARWLKAAEVYAARGSAQFVRREALRWLRALHLLRGDLGLPQRDDVVVTLVGDGDEPSQVKQLKVAERAAQYGIWPQTESGLLDGGVGYLRIERMLPEAGDEVNQWLQRFHDTAGLVIDVRGNGGGTRDALLALLPALLPPVAEPLVVNIAAYRLWQGFSADHLAARHLYPVDSQHWTPTERAALATFIAEFKPEWQPPTDEFSEWHAMVVSPIATPDVSLADDVDPVRYLDRPVAVLMDARCFSATDVFLSALKGLPNVTLVGEPSGGAVLGLRPSSYRPPDSRCDWPPWRRSNRRESCSMGMASNRTCWSDQNGSSSSAATTWSSNGPPAS